MAIGLAVMLPAGMARADDEALARRVCMPDAKRLCARQYAAMDRKGAEQCLWTNINQTTPSCHQMIVKVRAERQAAGRLK